MPTSITVVATSTSAPPAAKAAIASCFSRDLQLAVQQHDAEVAQLAAAQPLVLRGRGARLQRLGLLHQRADDERLAPGAQLLADAVVGPRALALGGGDVGVDRPPALRAARAGR